jgi:hypothetical protein
MKGTASANEAGKTTIVKATDEINLSTNLSGFDLTYATINSDAAHSDATAFTVAKEFQRVVVCRLRILIIWN